MDTQLTRAKYDLISSDGKITKIIKRETTRLEAHLLIEQISPYFRGFYLSKEELLFNCKSTLAQLGIDGSLHNAELSLQKRSAELHIELRALDPVGVQMLSLLDVGSYVGKLFAKDPVRRVRDPEYLLRIFHRTDSEGRPLLSLGGLVDKEQLLTKQGGRCIARVPLKEGFVNYGESIYDFLPTLAKALQNPDIKTRSLLKLHQKQHKSPGELCQDRILLVKTEPLHIRTVFALVADEFLPKGYTHTSARVLQPDTMESGDIYEFFGHSPEKIHTIPLEFYTLEPYKEHIFFADRDQLQAEIEQEKSLFTAFATAPDPKNHLAAVYIVKGSQLQNLEASDWISKDPQKAELPGIDDPIEQVHLINDYIKEQPSYPILKAIEDHVITSQGILLTRYFPSPLMKRLLLSDPVQQNLKQIYFEYPSRSSNAYFSHEDRALMLDLAKFSIDLFWVDHIGKKLLRYVLKPGKETGMFVPLQHVDTFRKATSFGIYGSNLMATDHEKDLSELFEKILQLKNEMDHPLLSRDLPLMIVTGGGPGAMEMGNRVAKKAGILSCANIVDFSSSSGVVNEQKVNPYIDAKMTYRIDQLVERQAEFYLDFPIFLPGGIGADFEYTLEEVRRKVGAQEPTPILLFGPLKEWQEKITPRFQSNLRQKTIRGSEWVSNCFYHVSSADEALEIYRKYFSDKLPIGKNGPIFEEGFCFKKH